MLKTSYLKNKYVIVIYKICERSIISLILLQTKDMPDKEKRTTVSITEKEREIIERLSVELMGRVNLSATLSYIVRQWTKMRKDND